MADDSSESKEEKERRQRLIELDRSARLLGLQDAYGEEVLPERTGSSKERSIPGICGTCVHSIIFKRPFGSARVFCNKMRAATIPSDLEWCSDHERPRRNVSLSDMERSALLIDVREGPPRTNAYL